MLKKINLKNKVALVTGAGKGLGKACAIALAEAGAKVIILSRTKSDLVNVSKIIKKTKGKSQSFVCDVTKLDELKNILKRINRLDILVNNAGNNRPQHFTEVSQENLDKVNKFRDNLLKQKTINLLHFYIFYICRCMSYEFKTCIFYYLRYSKNSKNQALSFLNLSQFLY